MPNHLPDVSFGPSSRDCSRLRISTGAYTVITTAVSKVGNLEASRADQIPGDHLWRKVLVLTSILVASFVVTDCQHKRARASKSLRQVLDAAIVNNNAKGNDKLLIGDYIAVIQGDRNLS